MEKHPEAVRELELPAFEMDPKSTATEVSEGETAVGQQQLRRERSTRIVPLHVE